MPTTKSEPLVPGLLISLIGFNGKIGQRGDSNFGSKAHPHPSRPPIMRLAYEEVSTF